MRDYVLRETTEADFVGTEPVDGVSTEHFKIRWRGEDLDLWVGPKEQPLLRKLSLNYVKVSSDRFVAAVEEFVAARQALLRPQ